MSVSYSVVWVKRNIPDDPFDWWREDIDTIEEARKELMEAEEVNASATTADLNIIPRIQRIETTFVATFVD